MLAQAEKSNRFKHIAATDEETLASVGPWHVSCSSRMLVLAFQHTSTLCPG